MRYPPISVHESAEDGVSKDAELGGLGFQVTPYLSIPLSSPLSSPLYGPYLSRPPGDR